MHIKRLKKWTITKVNAATLADSFLTGWTAKLADPLNELRSPLKLKACADLESVN